MTRARIMIVEDDPDIQAIAQMALETIGDMDVVACSSGQEALDTVSAVRPDLILLDFMMPGMDGEQVLRHLRGDPATASIPVVYMTARVRPEEVTRYQELGAVDVIPKPFDPMTLPARLQAVLDGLAR